MGSQVSDILEQQGRRLSLLQQLNAALSLAQTAILRQDVAGIEGGTALQLDLCQALLDSPALEFRNLPAGTKGRECQELAREITALEVRVRHQGRVQAALLRRSGRTALILSRLLNSAAVTYDPAQLTARPAGATE